MTGPPASDPRDDAALMAAVVDGDRSAFEVLYRRLGHLRWAAVLCAPPSSSPWRCAMSGGQ